MRPLAILLLLGEQVAAELNSTHRAGSISTCCSPCSWLCPSLVEIRLQRAPALLGSVGGWECTEASTEIWGMRAPWPTWSQPGLLWVPGTARPYQDLPCSVRSFGEQESIWMGTAQRCLFSFTCLRGVNQNISPSNTENSSISPIAGGGNSSSRT